MDESNHFPGIYGPGTLPGRKSVRETPGYSLFQGQLSHSYQPVESVSDMTGISNDLTAQSNLSPNSVTPGLIEFPDRSSMLAQEVAICHALTGLTNKQRQICLQHSGLVWAMLEGTRLGLHECVHQFKHEQWNCSAVNILYQLQTNSASVPKVSGLEGILQRGSRETAFLSSAWSAGVVQAITRACSRGQMGTCDCDPIRREGQDRDAEGVFTWGGCSDPIRFGMRLTRLFLDATDREHRQAAMEREEQLHGPLTRRDQKISRRSIQRNVMEANQQQRQKNPYRSRLHKRSPMRSASAANQTLVSTSVDIRRNLTGPNKFGSGSHGLSPQEIQAETLRIIQTKARALMNLHNRRAGRKLVWTNRVRKCKCHGVSGACSMRTCWQRVNEFRRVGSMLKAAYDDAIRVTYEPRDDRLKPIDSYGLHNRLSSGYDSRSMGYANGRLMNVRGRMDWLVPMRNYYGAGDGDGGVAGGIGSGSINPLFPSTVTPESTSWRRHRWPRSTMSVGQPSKAKLVYLEESPNYCRHDPSIGHLGIAGRLCNASSSDAPNSCNRLCCDRGYDTFEYESERKCDCKFFWCCEVRCKVCRERTMEHRCKH
ncbi:Protein Wnt [Fasciola gigantica]|uniref:Protein Wnt n=1 Tax=Fasciola gigantica TaxID=46835 RepID=A0A504YVP8_FASGI|nr:Protein Wnt [Fasciola gigantica]